MSPSSAQLVGLVAGFCTKLGLQFDRTLAQRSYSESLSADDPSQSPTDAVRAIGSLVNLRIQGEPLTLAEVHRLAGNQVPVGAPRDGTIYRLPVYERGQTIREGETLFTIVPSTTERAVELYIKGNDISLIHAGDHVRLQFEGWPAIQFSGWPNAAVGTFGGQVARVDPTDDGTGKFRIQVIPEKDTEWPEVQYLRQGVRANGWVMLNTVTLGYEIWRQLNGFPPVIDEPKGKRSRKRFPCRSRSNFSTAKSTKAV